MSEAFLKEMVSYIATWFLIVGIFLAAFLSIAIYLKWRSNEHL